MSTIVASLTPTGAIVAYLNADATLTTLAPGGTWIDPAPEDATPVVEGQAPNVFVTVRLLSDRPQPCGGGAAYHDALYAVQAVGPADRLAAIEEAALRIDTLLTRSEAAGREVEGWGVVGLRLEEVIEYPDPEVATGIRWEHRGGQYRVQVEPAA